MARNKNSRDYRITRRTLIGGGLFFCVYSYLLLTQGFDHQLRIMGSEYARLLSMRVPIPASLLALVMVTVLQGIQILTRKIFRVRTRFLLLTYLPSLCGLFLYVWMRGNTFDTDKMYTHHLIVAGVFAFLLLVWIFKSLMLRGDRMIYTNDSIPNYPVWRLYNLVLLALCFFVIGVLSPMRQSVRNEAAMLQAVQANELFKVLEIDPNNPHPTQRMTQLRNRALLESGMLGERMFEFPQNYGASGLEQETEVPTGNARMVQQYEYRLASLLLEKRVDEFMDELANYAPHFSGQKLPKHYLEAYALYVYSHPERPYIIADSALYEQFANYLSLRDRYRTREERKIALAFTNFRTTYWWYYEFTGVEE